MKLPRIVIPLLVAVGVTVTLAGCQDPSSVLRGRVTTASGAHYSGIAVTVYSNVTETVVAQTTTDGDGDYSVLPAALPDGTYRIRFAANQWWSGASSWADATPVTVSQVAPAVVDTTVFVPEGTVAGIVSGVGQPSAGVKVEVQDSSSWATVARTTTAADGSYAVPVPIGSYVIQFSADGLPVRYNGSAIAREAASRVRVRAFDQLQNVNATLSDWSTITGSVTDGSDPLPGIYAVACDPATGQARSVAATGADGRFTLTGVDAVPSTVGFVDAAGTYRTRIYGSASADCATGIQVTPVGGTVDIGATSLVRTAGPDAPAAADAVPGDTTATVTWTAPANIAEFPVTGYTVKASSGPTCTTTGALTCTVSGLTNGTAVTFTVTASGASSDSAPSAPTAAVTPLPADFCQQSQVEGYFANAQFTNADFTECDFTGATFWDANLTNATFTDADLSETDLAGATVTGADLATATLRLARTTSLTGEPASLPARWAFLDGGAGHSHLIGPGGRLWSVDLTDQDLTGFDFSDTEMDGVDFVRADLSGVDLSGAKILNANFEDADLTGADLTGVSSQYVSGPGAALPTDWQILSSYLVGPGADLDDVSLPGADLEGANLAGTTFDAADLSGANLAGADLTGAALTKTNLGRADLSGADLTDADLTSARLTGGTLAGAEIGGADFTHANLGSDHVEDGVTFQRGAITGGLTGTPAVLPSTFDPDGPWAEWKLVEGYLVGPRAYLVGASLSGADLSGADLRGAQLATADLSGADLTGVDGTGIYDTTVSRTMFASFDQTNLAGADLTDADFTNASFQSPIIVGATVTNTDFGLGPDKFFIPTTQVIGIPKQLPFGWKLVNGFIQHT